MHTRTKILSGGLLAVLGALGLLLSGACGGEAVSGGLRAVSPEKYVSTGFDDCGTRAAANPRPVAVSDSAASTLLHGVWVGYRTVKDGMSLEPNLTPGLEPKSHYVLILDTRAGEGIAYDERGSAVTENAFGVLLPRGPAGGPRIVYFYCGGELFKPFRDDFIKVSDDPADGLRAMARVTGVAIGDSSISAAWAALREANFFTRPREGAFLNTAYYTVTVRGGQNGVRWDMVGEYRGSPAKYPQGQPRSGLEGGVFSGVSTASGDYLMGSELHIPCYGDPAPTPVHTQGAGGFSVSPAPGRGTNATASADTMGLVRYSKIVIGPFP